MELSSVAKIIISFTTFFILFGGMYLVVAKNIFTESYYTFEYIGKQFQIVKSQTLFVLYEGSSRITRKRVGVVCVWGSGIDKLEREAKDEINRAYPLELDEYKRIQKEKKDKEIKAVYNSAK